MRDRFDQFLIDRASEAGTKILDGEKVTNVEEGADAVKVGLAKGWSSAARFWSEQMDQKAWWPSLYPCDPRIMMDMGLPSKAKLLSIHPFLFRKRNFNSSIWISVESNGYGGFSQKGMSLHRYRRNV